MSARAVGHDFVGRLLYKELRARGMTPKQLVGRTHYSDAMVYQVLAGQHGISKRMSRALSEVFGSSPEFWYRLYLNSDIGRPER